MKTSAERFENLNHVDVGRDIILLRYDQYCDLVHEVAALRQEVDELKNSVTNGDFSHLNNAEN